MSKSPNDTQASREGMVGDGRLHRLHDGELGAMTAEARRALRAALSDEEGSKLAALSELGYLLRHTAHTDHDALVERFDAWAGIEERIGEGKVVTLLSRLRRNRLPLWVSTVVAAAAVLLVLIFPFGGSEGKNGNGCVIEDLEVTGADVTIMKLAEQRGEGTTTVVWLHETE